MRLTGEQIWEREHNFPYAVEDPNGMTVGYGSMHKWTKWSIFWELPYWKTHLVRHNLDMMHVEKNVFDNMINTFDGCF